MLKAKLKNWLVKNKLWKPKDDKYSSYAELVANEKPSSFDIEVIDRKSLISIMAIHGGRLEPGASKIAKAIAGNDFNYYSFNARKLFNNWSLHVTSTSFDEPQALAMAQNSKMVVTVHGCLGLGAIAYTGGDINPQLREELENRLTTAGIQSFIHPKFPGTGKYNICNKGAQGGLQLELTPSLRLSWLQKRKRKKLVKIIREFLLQL